MIELVRGNNSGYSWIWSQYDLDRLRREQVEWVIVQEHPHLKYSQTDLSLAAELLPCEVEKFDPFTGTKIPVYDRIDAFYLPVADFGGLNQPGPIISIYRIDTP